MNRLTSRELYARLLRYVAPYWRIFAVALLGMVVMGASEPALPALLKPLLDGTFIERDPDTIAIMPWLLVGIFIVRGAGHYCASYAMGWVGNRVVQDLREAMFARLLRLPTPYYDDHPTGNVISRLTYDVTQVTSAATSVLVIAVQETIALVGLVGWLLWLNWRLTLFALVMFPVIALIVRASSVRLRRSSRDTQTSMGDLTQVLEEAVNGQKVIKLFGGDRYESERFSAAANRVRRANLRQTAAAAIAMPLTQLAAATAMAVIVYLATRTAQADTTTAGGFVSFIAAMLMLTAPLKRLAGVNEHLQRGLAAAESVFELIDEPAEPDPGTVTLQRARGELRFDAVTFRYAGRAEPALADVTLTVAPGESVALVGQSGSGKSTLAALVPRFYHPTAGRILLDGHDLESLAIASLRANIALVSQDVVLFNDTVAANIAYGALRGTDRARVEAAAEAAHATAFIRALPDGFDTVVGENGVKLSGGQRQRLAIARAVLKDAPVLILDEATSALDSESERHVQAAMEALMRGRTTLVIAHRLSTIEKADRIVVLEAGRIVEVGRHAELLAAAGAYARLYRTQYAAAR